MRSQAHTERTQQSSPFLEPLYAPNTSAVALGGIAPPKAMPHCKRERLSGSFPLAFLSMPIGGTLTVAMTLTALRQSALTATSLRISPGATTPRMLLRSRRLCDHGREEDCGYRVGNRFAVRLRRSGAGMQNGGGDQQHDGVAMQVSCVRTGTFTFVLA